MILNRIKKYIEANELLQRGDRVLVGLSGGADSVCLTHALQSLSKQLGIEVYTAHVNHGIRGEEAVRDEEFAKSFSEKLGISCFTARLNIPEDARQKSISEETAGRIARYEFFNKIAAENRLTKIATAHNRNDNAETLLMNFMRGSTVKGLGGIPVRRGNIVRPILCLTRTEIEEYCRENSLEYVTDSTNNETIYTRNKIRRELIPLIERTYNPNFVTTATENAVLTAEDNAYIAKQAENAFISLAADNKADIKELKKLDKSILRRVLMLMIQSAVGEEEDIRSVYIRDVSRLLNKNSGASVNLPFGIIAKTEYGKLIIEKKPESVPCFEYIMTIGNTKISELGSEVVISKANVREKDGAVYVCAGETDIITIRNRRSGDVFMPCGMNGSKKVKEYFINEKIPREKRALTPIICINGEIAAVGTRVDRRFMFKDKGLRIEFKPMQEV